MSPQTWRNHVLILRQRSRPHSVWWLWRSPSWELIGGYVNFETPFVRAKGGLDTRDHFLDIVISPDGRCRIKDNEELTAKVGAGAVTPRLARTLRERAAHRRRSLAIAGRW